MLLYTVFQFTMIFELLFFLLWAFPSRGNKSAQITSAAKEAPDVRNSGSCDVQEQCGLCETTTDGGAITSPDYPNEYRSGLNCLITVRAPLNAAIELTFTEFVVEQCCDLVTVFNGDDDPFELRLAGNVIPEVITSLSGEIKIKFKSNDNSTNVIQSPVLRSARWQAKFKFLHNETIITASQLDSIRNETERLELAITEMTV